MRFVPSIRVRRRAWLGVSIVLACLWLASLGWNAGWTRRTASSETHIWVDRACIAVAWITSSHDEPFDTWSFGPSTGWPRWLPYWIYHGTRSYWALWIPLWMLAVVPGAASVISFRRLFRWRRTGRCLECGYSLVGLPPGTPCPECGHTRHA